MKTFKEYMEMAAGPEERGARKKADDSIKLLGDVSTFLKTLESKIDKEIRTAKKDKGTFDVIIPIFIPKNRNITKSELNDELKKLAVKYGKKWKEANIYVYGRFRPYGSNEVGVELSK